MAQLEDEQPPQEEPPPTGAVLPIESLATEANRDGIRREAHLHFGQLASS